MKMNAKNSQSGFSLIELMIVVGIIGILTTIAVPRFQMFQAKARRTEAVVNLGQIYTLEQAYFAEKGVYAPIAAAGTAIGRRVATTPVCSKVANDVGFYLDGCTATSPNVRYKYWVTTASGNTTFTANAEAFGSLIVEGCPATTTDTWTMTEAKLLTNSKDAIKDC